MKYWEFLDGSKDSLDQSIKYKEQPLHENTKTEFKKKKTLYTSKR